MSFFSLYEKYAENRTSGHLDLTVEPRDIMDELHLSHSGLWAKKYLTETLKCQVMCLDKGDDAGEASKTEDPEPLPAALDPWAQGCLPIVHFTHEFANMSLQEDQSDSHQVRIRSSWPVGKRLTSSLLSINEKGTAPLGDSSGKPSPTGCTQPQVPGGLICRGVLSVLPNHNVHTFIALASPLAGQCRVRDATGLMFSMLQQICYSKFAQNHYSFCNYWNDPHRRFNYLKYNNFLLLLNGEKVHSNMAEWKRNFQRIETLVLIGGPDDEVIMPWQSSHFGFYNSKEGIINMREQRFYRENTFGLRTLDARGDLITCSQSGVKHTEWHSNRKVFERCIKKWLY